jgi:hypothetical protein
MANTTAIQLVKSAAMRLGMQSPLTLPIISGAATTIEDKDALLLLGALNAAVKNVAFMYTWRELIRFAQFWPNMYDNSAQFATTAGIPVPYDPPIKPEPTPTPGYGAEEEDVYEEVPGKFVYKDISGVLTKVPLTRLVKEGAKIPRDLVRPHPPQDLDPDYKFIGFDINILCRGFDGIISNCILHPDNPDGNTKVPLLSYDKYSRMISNVNNDDIYDAPRQNGYIIYNGLLQLVYNYYYEKEVEDQRFMSFFYKTKYPVIKAGAPLWDNSALQMYFVNDGDWSPIDDEILVLGTVINYKNYIGRDFQLEFKQYNDYIEHMKERTGGVTVLEESSYTEMSNIFHRYPPVGQGGGAGGNPTPKQGGGPQKK